MGPAHASAPLADSLHVQPGEAFAEVLDRELGRIAPEPARYASAAGQTRQPFFPNPFLFVAYGPLTAAGRLRRSVPTADSAEPARFVAPDTTPRAAVNSSRPAPPMARPTLAPSRPVRILAARERRALRELIALGAELDASFTIAELRHAFRVLARRYHPDRHPGRDAETLANLARTFAQLSENHRCLLAVLEPVGPLRH